MEGPPVPQDASGTTEATPAAPKPRRRAPGGPGNRKLLPKQGDLDKESRARAWALFLVDVAGSDAQPPMPVAPAARRYGLEPRMIVERLARGCAPDLEAARSEGLARCLRGAMSDSPAARQWAWLAERLAPKELHLPTKITGVSAEDGGAPIASVQVTLSRAEALQLARGDVPRLALPGPARTLPRGK